MAKSVQVVTTCDRCKGVMQTQTQAELPTAKADEPRPIPVLCIERMEAGVRCEPVVYGDLCDDCNEVVKQALAVILGQDAILAAETPEAPSPALGAMVDVVTAPATVGTPDVALPKKRGGRKPRAVPSDVGAPSVAVVTPTAAVVESTAASTPQELKEVQDVAPSVPDSVPAPEVTQVVPESATAAEVSAPSLAEVSLDAPESSPMPEVAEEKPAAPALATSEIPTPAPAPAPAPADIDPF